MSDKSKEQISNLMDGELEVNASKFLLKRMAADESLSDSWQSYHLIKSCIQKQPNEPLVVDVAARVCEQINQNNIPLSNTIINDNTQSGLNKWLKPVLGTAIAASVAFMSVFMIQNKNNKSVFPIEQPTITHETVLQPLPINISANMVSGKQLFVNPPASLSRFPSVSAKNTYNYQQGVSQNDITPYLIILNQKKPQKQLVPLRKKLISD